MILSRAPTRITLGGGGTDLKSYYSKYGGFLIAGAIDKYILISANKQFFNTYKLNYSKREETKKIDDIQHNLFREAIRQTKVGTGIELTSMSDVPDKSGLGSSGSFLVCLLGALHAYKNESISKQDLAEEACKIEIEILKEHVPKINYLPYNKNTGLDSIYTHDPVKITKSGAILLSMEKESRENESQAIKDYLIKSNIPIIGSITGGGKVEG